MDRNASGVSCFSDPRPATAVTAPLSSDRSYYAAVNPAPPPRAALAGEARADVAIIGAGLTCLSAALHLA